MRTGYDYLWLNVFRELGCDKSGHSEDSPEEDLCAFVEDCLEEMIPRNHDWLSAVHPKTSRICKTFFRLWIEDSHLGRRLLEVINRKMVSFGFYSKGSDLNRRWFNYNRY